MTYHSLANTPEADTADGLVALVCAVGRQIGNVLKGAVQGALAPQTGNFHDVALEGATRAQQRLRKWYEDWREEWKYTPDGFGGFRELSPERFILDFFEYDVASLAAVLLELMGRPALLWPGLTSVKLQEMIGSSEDRRKVAKSLGFDIDCEHSEFYSDWLDQLRAAVHRKWFESPR